MDTGDTSRYTVPLLCLNHVCTMSHVLDIIIEDEATVVTLIVNGEWYREGVERLIRETWS